ncbi:DUF5977 domain-containing protein, partial [Ornithobacterium rhinotracheale]
GVTPPGGGGTPSNPNLSVAVEPAGFEGTYTAGTPVGPGNKVKFKLINNSFFPINHLDLSDAFSISNPGSNNLQVWGRGQNNDISLKSGESITLSYNLTGTPNAGVLAAFFDKNGLHAEQSINIGKGTATFTNPSITANVVSINSAGASVQGVIDNNSHRLTIKIPYTNGKGAYDAVSVTKASAEGQGGDINDLTLKIAEGSFSGRGNLTASIEVGGDGVYQVKQMPVGQSYTIATFSVSMGNATFTVEVKGFGGYTSTQTQSFNKNFTRNNCSSGYYGTSVNYSREATATAVSAISQADADKKAREKALAEATKLVNDGGQNHANQNGSCRSSGSGGGGADIRSLNVHWSGMVYEESGWIDGANVGERRGYFKYYLTSGDTSEEQLCRKLKGDIVERARRSKAVYAVTGIECWVDMYPIDFNTGYGTVKLGDWHK